MFLDTSRYAQVDQADAALKLRRLPAVTGEDYAVKDNDRLDLLAQSRYADGTRFWHIADANTALDARTLTAEIGGHLTLPRS